MNYVELNKKNEGDVKILSKSMLNAIKEGNTKAFYISSMWLNKRVEIIERDNNECQRCKANGKYHSAECVHHIKHLRDRPDLALTGCNLISLCYTCHNVVHPEKLHINNKRKFKNKERW